MTTTPRPTGRRDDRDRDWIVFTRRFRAPIDDVWAAATDPDRMARWIGTWTGDPSSGRVDFAMTAEGEDVPAEPHTIEVCDPPHRLVVSTVDADGNTWRMRLDLTEADGTTTLVFGQQMTDPDVAASVGPGWDYYLDRLVAAEAGQDVASIDFDDYYPALSDHYRTLLA